MMKRLKIYNGCVLTAGRIIPNGTVLVEGGKIVQVKEGAVEAADAIGIDAGGRYVSPGFIDIHVHGGGGYDFMDGTVEAFLGVAETHARYGTTSMLPTTLTCAKETLFTIFDAYREAHRQNVSGAQFLGLHLEGPYLAMNQRGAQDPRYIRNPDPEEYREILRRSPDIKRWSAAPELEGALAFGDHLQSLGILAALAHTDAIFGEVVAGYKHGFTLATHFYSCMNGVTRRGLYRHAGAIECAYLIDEMDVEVIADGIHLPAPLLRLVHKIKGAGHTALITDAMRAAGMPEGESILGSLRDGLRVIVENGVAMLPDRSAFAGSVATADRLIRTMVREAGVGLAEAISMISATPAAILGIGHSKGSLAPGMDADIVLFNDNIEVTMTIAGGKIIYSA
ncbi:MAG TPA: N-acetylglucosamine-6-phosphate deacetylase [Puia sp.]|jgi:N-acetylglucosamine-6-phosphate deacetylase|nr:N-acetylglucosamine-6-phosphate deacetylase [Puia sp.]